MPNKEKNVNTIEPKIKTKWLTLFISIPLFLITILLWWFLYQQKINNLNKRIELEAQKISSYIEKDMAARMLALSRLASRWETRKGTPLNEFTVDAMNYVEDMPGLTAVSWVDENYIVRWIIPVTGNEKAVNLNLANEKKRFIELEKSRNTDKPKMTKAIDLLQGEKGLLVYFPLNYDNKFNGFIVAVITIREWIDYILTTHNDEENINNFKIQVTYNDSVIYRQKDWESQGKKNNLAIQTFSLQQHVYKLHCSPAKSFYSKYNNYIIEIAGIFGIALCFFVSFTVWLFFKANNEIWKSSIVKRDLENEIKARKETELTLQETSTRLSLATKAGKIGIWSWDSETNRLTWDSTMYELYDIPADVSPTFDTWTNSLYIEDREKSVRLINDAIMGKAVFDTEFRIVLSDSSIKYIHAAAKMIRDNTGIPKGMIGANWDISDLKKTQITLKQQTEMQEILMDISTKYINISLNEVDEAINTALEEMGKFVNADRGYVFKYDLKKQTTSNLYEWCNNNIKPQISELQDLPLEGIPDWVFAHKQGKPMIVPDVSQMDNKNLKELLEPQGIKTLIAVPMETNKTLIGFVGFDWVNNIYNYSDKELTLLNLFSQILVNIRLRTKAEKMLLESQKRLDMALKATKAALWDWYIEEDKVILNEKWAEIMGYTLKELEPITFQIIADLIHPDDIINFKESIQSYLDRKDEFYSYEGRLKHKNGEWLWIHSRGKLVEWDEHGKPLRMIGTQIDITERKKAEKTIKHMANHDSLTDLPTMRLAKDRAHITNKRSIRNNKMTAYLFLDLDGFKSINDNYGHDAGDILLKETADRFLNCIRQSDTAARIGGDEFLFIISDMQTVEEAKVVADKILKSIAEPFYINEIKMNVGASIGISFFPKDSNDIDYLIKLADTAMYTIKKTTKNNYSFSHAG